MGRAGFPRRVRKRRNEASLFLVHREVLPQANRGGGGGGRPSPYVAIACGHKASGNVRKVER